MRRKPAVGGPGAEAEGPGPNTQVDWVRVYDLELQQGEYSYPSILHRDDGLFLAYTFNREGIKLVELDVPTLIGMAEKNVDR